MYKLQNKNLTKGLPLSLISLTRRATVNGVANSVEINQIVPIMVLAVVFDNFLLKS